MRHGSWDVCSVQSVCCDILDNSEHQGCPRVNPWTIHLFVYKMSEIPTHRSNIITIIYFDHGLCALNMKLRWWSKNSA